MDRAPTIAVLAGGLATRLGEIAKRTPKSLVEIHGRPFLAWQLDLFAAQGLRDVVLCIGHHGEQIEEWVERNAVPNVRIRFSRDGDRQLGTGGAILKALPTLSDPFLVAYGDSYLRCDYLGVYSHFMELRRLAEEPRPLGLMTVYENRNRHDASNVVLRNDRIVCYDKRHRSAEMKHIDWGLGVLTKQAFEPFSTTASFDLGQIYRNLVVQGGLAALKMHERFYEVGSTSGLDEFRRHIAATSRDS